MSASLGLQWNGNCIVPCERDAKPMMQSLFTLCAAGYLLIYAFKGALRYGLYNSGLDNAILLRDGLIIAPGKPLLGLFTLIWLFSTSGVVLAESAARSASMRPTSSTPSDNFFVFLYANFGLMGIVYLAWSSSQGLGLPRASRAAAIAPLAVLAFNLAYGAALSMLEDQVSALFIGAATGMLWQLRRTTIARSLSDPYHGTPSRLPDGLSPVPAANSARLAHAR